MVTRVPLYLGGTGESTQSAAQAALGLHSSNSVVFTTVTIGSTNVLANDGATYFLALANDFTTYQWARDNDVRTFANAQSNDFTTYNNALSNDFATYQWARDNDIRTFANAQSNDFTTYQWARDNDVRTFANAQSNDFTTYNNALSNDFATYQWARDNDIRTFANAQSNDFTTYQWARDNDVRTFANAQSNDFTTYNNALSNDFATYQWARDNDVRTFANAQSNDFTTYNNALSNDFATYQWARGNDYTTYNTLNSAKVNKAGDSMTGNLAMSSSNVTFTITAANSGMYWGTSSNAFVHSPISTSNTLVLGTASTERMRISSSGNVAIGTAAGSSAASEQLTVQGFGGFGDRATTNPFVLIGNTGSGAGLVGTYSSHALEVRTNNTERMRITSAGDVGIGTSSPGAGIELSRTSGQPTILVNSVQAAGYGPSFLALRRLGSGGAATPNSSSIGQIRFDGYDSTPAYALFASIECQIGTNAAGGAPGALTFSTSPSGASVSERMRIDSSGQVGIGTTSPATKLDVNGAIRVNAGASYQVYGASGTTDQKIWDMYSDNSTANSLYLRAVNDAYTAAYSWLTITRSGYQPQVIAFYTGAGSERMRIDSSGNVGIGTTSPGQKLDVVGNMLLSGQSTADQYIRIGSGRSGNGYSYIDLQGDTTYSNGLRLIRNNAGANSESSIEHRGTGDLKLVTQEAAGIAVYTNGANLRMFVTSGGLVGIGTSSPAATLDVVGSFSHAKANILSQTLTDAATISWDTSLGQIATVTLGASRTMGAPTNLKVGTYILHVIQGGAGTPAYDITWNGVFKWTAGVKPTLSTVAGRRDVFSFISDGTNLYGAMIPDVR